MFFKRRKLQSRPVFRAEKNSTRSCNCGAAGSGGPVITGAVVPLLIGTKLYFLMTGCVCVCVTDSPTQSLHTVDWPTVEPGIS